MLYNQTRSNPSMKSNPQNPISNSRRSYRKIFSSDLKYGHSDDDGSWAVSYGDMITLLLAFFILFFSVDSGEVNKHKLLTILVDRLSEQHVQKKDEPQIFGASPQRKIGEKIAETINKPKESIFNHDITIKGDSKKVGSLEKAKITKVGTKIYVEFPNVSFFNSGKTEVLQGAKLILKEFTNVYVPFAGTHILNILGYTDPRPIKTSKRRFKDNLELSVMRSLAAQRFMSESGIPLNVMRIGGHGVFQDDLKLIEDENERMKAYDYSRKIVLVIEATGDL